MQIEPERRGAVGQENGQRRGVRRIEGAGAGILPCPDGLQRQQIRKVERIDDGPAQIGVTVAGQAAEPGFQRVDGLNAAAEARRLYGPAQRAGILRQDFRILVQQDDAGGQIACTDDPGLDFRLGVFRIFAHGQRIPVDLGVGIVQELIHETEDALVPALDLPVDFPFRIILVKADEAGGVA